MIYLRILTCKIHSRDLHPEVFHSKFKMIRWLVARVWSNSPLNSHRINSVSRPKARVFNRQLVTQWAMLSRSSQLLKMPVLNSRLSFCTVNYLNKLSNFIRKFKQFRCKKTRLNSSWMRIRSTSCLIRARRSRFSSNYSRLMQQKNRSKDKLSSWGRTQKACRINWIC